MYLKMSCRSRIFLVATVIYMFAATSCVNGELDAHTVGQFSAEYTVSIDGSGRPQVDILGRHYEHSLLDTSRCFIEVHNGGSWLYIDHELGKVGRIVDISPGKRRGRACEITIPLVASRDEPPETPETRRAFLELCKAMSSMKAPVLRLMDYRGGTLGEPKWRRIHMHDARDLTKCTDLRSPPAPYVIDINFARGTLSLIKPGSPPPARLTQAETTWPDQQSFYRKYSEDTCKYDRFGGLSLPSSIAKADANSASLSSRWTKSTFSYSRGYMTWEGERGAGVAWDGNHQVIKERNFHVRIFKDTFTHPAYKESPGFITIHGEKDWYLYVEEGAIRKVLIIEPDASRVSEINVGSSGANPASGIDVLISDLCQMVNPAVELVDCSRTLEGKIASVRLLWRGPWSGERSYLDFTLRSYVVDLDFITQSVRCYEVGPTVDWSYIVKGELPYEVPWDLRVRRGR